MQSQFWHSSDHAAFPNSSGSPWAIDALIRDSGASHSIDHGLDAIYCRIAEQTHRASWPANVPAPQIPPPGGTASPSGPLFQAEFGTCIGGQNRFAWPLKQIEQLWQAHGDSPKFAFYSSSPLHAWLQEPMVSNSETGIPTHKRAALEAYDATLSDFLDPFLHRHPNTLILLRGDHGQHHGPEAVEFDVQVEHRMPWGRLLVPSRLVPDANLLRTNAERLLSPFDLHATLQGVMLRGTNAQRAQPEETKATASNAPIDLLMTEVPALRTCREARIPAWLCPCQHERVASGDSSYAPFGVSRSDQIETKERLRKEKATEDERDQGINLRLLNRQVSEAKRPAPGRKGKRGGGRGYAMQTSALLPQLPTGKSLERKGRAKKNPTI